MRDRLRRFWNDDVASEEVSSHVILMAGAAVFGLAVLGGLGYAAWKFFHHVGRCLNGC